MMFSYCFQSRKNAESKIPSVIKTKNRKTMRLYCTV